MAGWQSHFIMCALNTGDSTMWNTEAPHPCPKPGWIILMKHQIIAFGSCSKRHISASRSAVGCSPWPVIVLQTISRLAVEICPHTVVCWPLSGLPREADCCTLVGNCFTLKKGVLPETSVLNKMTELEYSLGHFIIQKCPEYPGMYNCFNTHTDLNRKLWQKTKMAFKLRPNVFIHWP